MGVARIWCNRLEARTKKFEDCPSKYVKQVKELLQEDVRNGVITADDYKEITGEEMPT